jgi:hypothetical protein
VHAFSSSLLSLAHFTLPTFHQHSPVFTLFCYLFVLFKKDKFIVLVMRQQDVSTKNEVNFVCSHFIFSYVSIHSIQLPTLYCIVLYCIVLYCIVELTGVNLKHSIHSCTQLHYYLYLSLALIFVFTSHSH